MVSAVAAGGTKALEKLTSDSGKPGKTLESLKFELTGALAEIASSEALRYVSSSAQDGIPHVPEGFLNNFVDATKIKARLEKLAKSDEAEAQHAKELLGLWWDEK